ncbi:hypothetical protein Dimus_016283 [Dionaea muscipula]
MTITHLKKKDVVKSSVKGVVIEFDHDKWLTSLVYTETMEFVRSGENRRRDDDNVPEEEAQEEEGNQAEFDWEVVIDEAAEQGESGSDDKFFDAQVDVEEPMMKLRLLRSGCSRFGSTKETEASGVDPSGGPSGHLPEAVMNKLQAEFERARANRFQADLEKAQAENARLLALLQQAQSKPKP